jgi:hypothetical protein
VKKSSILLMSLALLVSCSKVDKMEDKTTSMEKTTKSMSTTTDRLESTTATMYQQIRSKESEATRDTKFHEVLDEHVEMGAKLTAAGVYFKSFEFQLWTSNPKFDSEAVRDLLFLDAVNEFSRRMVDLYDHVNLKKMSPIDSVKSRNENMAFYAIATTLHMNHNFQEVLLNKKETSFYDLMKGALLKDAKGEELKDYEEVLVAGINKEIMIELIKARVDMMAALGLKNLTDKRQMSLGQKARALIFQTTGGKLGSIDLPETFDKDNNATKSAVETYLSGAMKARNFLTSIGVEKKLNKTINSALLNIDFNETDAQAEEKTDSKKEEIKTILKSLLN